MIYLYQTQTGIEPHTDKEFAENVLNLGEPIAELTEQEWNDVGGLARMIDGVLVLGKTETEKQAEALQEQAQEAQRQLDATDKYVAKCYDLALVFADEYPELHEQRKVWRQTIRDARDEN